MSEDLEHIDVLRRQNKALRKINKILRGALKTSKEYSDELFMVLCDSDEDADIALEKLWTLGGFSEICGPRDYHKIVEVCLSKMNVTIPIDQS